MQQNNSSSNSRGRGVDNINGGRGGSGSKSGVPQSTRALHPSFLIGAPPLMDHTRPFVCPTGATVKDVWDMTIARIDAVQLSMWPPAMARMAEQYKSKVMRLLL